MRTLAVLSLAVLAACTGGTPSVDQARAKFEARWKDEIAQGMKVAEFRKTDGQQQRFMGMEMYRMSYEAVIEWPKGGFMDAGGSLCQKQRIVNPCEDKPPGTRITQTGSITFEKSENGWKAD